MRLNIRLKVNDYHFDSKMDELILLFQYRFWNWHRSGKRRKLFDRYYRVDNTAIRFNGLGLGLFISAEILNRHQSKCWVESELGKGSAFYFQLPIVRDENVTLPAINIHLTEDSERVN